MITAAKGLVVVLLAAASLANAATESSNAIAGKAHQPVIETMPKGLHPFLGIGAGYTPSNSQAPVEGMPANVRLLGSYYVDGAAVAPAVFDLGVGLAGQKLNGTTQNSGFLEAAARYQWPSRWQAGVVFSDFLNQGRSYNASQGDAQFLGFQALRELTLEKQWLTRIGGRAMTETNHVGTPVYMFLLEAQLSWLPNRADAAPSAASNLAAPAPTVVAEKPVVAPAAENASILSSMLYSQRSANGTPLTTFDLSKAVISKSDSNYLDKLAKVLKQNSNLFGKIAVQGYADATGTDSMNQRVSLARAEAVKAELAKKSGLDISRFIAVGNGAAASLGKSEADRRVELQFTDVKDANTLQNSLSSIQ